MLLVWQWTARSLALIFFLSVLAGYATHAHAKDSATGSECKNEIFQRGIASIYGYGWDSKKTANSESFKSDAMTAAHPNLPFGTMVEIMDVKTGAKTIVRINDRGPFIKGRIIDVTPAVRSKLGWPKTGLRKVALRICPL